MFRHGFKSPSIQGSKCGTYLTSGYQYANIPNTSCIFKIKLTFSIIFWSVPTLHTRVVVGILVLCHDWICQSNKRAPVAVNTQFLTQQYPLKIITGRTYILLNSQEPTRVKTDALLGCFDFVGNFIRPVNSLNILYITPNFRQFYQSKRYMTG